MDKEEFVIKLLLLSFKAVPIYSIDFLDEVGIQEYDYEFQNDYKRPCVTVELFAYPGAAIHFDVPREDDTRISRTENFDAYEPALGLVKWWLSKYKERCNDRNF
jgi:hypothetical protein